MKKEGLIFLFSCCFVVLSLLLILSLVVADSITGEVITGETITGEAILGNSNVSINVVASINITVDSPKNITYEFNSADEIAIELNVSADSTPDVWWFTLTNLEVEPYVVLNDSVIFTPNITIHPGVGSHSVVVYANSSFNVTFSETVLFYTQITNSAPEIQGVDDEIFVCENTALLYYFNITDVDGGDITADISPKNPFFISPTSYSGSVTRKITLYSPVLSKSDVRGRTNGTYEEEISATDGSSSDVKMTNITIIEVNNEPVVENIVTRTIWTVSDNRTFYEIVDVNDEEDGNQNSGNLSFNLTFLNGVEPFFNISNFGVMNFTANETYLGPDNSSRVYNFSLCVIDRALESPHQNISLCEPQNATNKTSCQNFSFTVTAQNRAPSVDSYSPTNLNLSVLGTDTSVFSITEHDPDGTTPDAYWFVDDSFRELDTGSLSDSFDYSFGCGVSGLHSVKVEITDGLLDCYNSIDCNASMQWNITVENVACSISGVGPGGGGGGGGGSGSVCTPTWACDDWTVCKNAAIGLEIGELFGEDYRNLQLECAANYFNEETCGHQTRICFDVNNCSSALNKPFGLQACHYTENPTCFDKIKNCHGGVCEFLIDCGGPCQKCPTCSDGIQNQGEEDVDCGGPCPSQCLVESPMLTVGEGTLIYVFVVVALFIILGIKLYQIVKMKKKV